jgi:hypothetical protein
LRGDESVIEPLGTPNLAEEIEKSTLLRSLGRALAEPVRPDDSALEYVPTQYLSEVIRVAGYDGMCFESALDPDGTNVVIFDPANARITRRAWVFELGEAKYTIQPNPKYIVRDGGNRKWTRSISSILGPLSKPASSPKLPSSSHSEAGKGVGL